MATFFIIFQIFHLTAGVTGALQEATGRVPHTRLTAKRGLQAPAGRGLELDVVHFSIHQLTDGGARLQAKRAFSNFI